MIGKMGKDRGVILLITLWILVILASVAMSYAYYAKLDVEMTTYNANSARARYLAKTGFYKACNLLRDDKLKDVDLLDNDDLIELDDDDIGYQYDAMTEEWYSEWYDEDEEDGVKRTHYPEEDSPGLFRVKVVDEGGKININRASREVIRDLLIVTGVEEEKADRISGAIIDWRDTDEEPTEVEEGLGDEYGDLYTEDTYYNPDQREDDIRTSGPVYVNKNAPFDNIEELLLIKGMDPFILNGEDLNGNGKLDDNERDGNASPPNDNGDSDLFLGLRDYITVYSEGKLNINTVEPKALEAVMMSLDESNAEDDAEDVVGYIRGSDDEPGTRDDRPMRTPDDSDQDDYDISKTGITMSDIGGVISVGVSSDVFLIESIGEYNGVQRLIRAVVRRDFQEPEALKGKRADEEDERDEEEEGPKREIVELFVIWFTEEGV